MSQAQTYPLKYHLTNWIRIHKTNYLLIDANNKKTWKTRSIEKSFQSRKNPQNGIFGRIRSFEFLILRCCDTNIWSLYRTFIFLCSHRQFIWDILKLFVKRHWIHPIRDFARKCLTRLQMDKTTTGVKKLYWCLVPLCPTT